MTTSLSDKTQLISERSTGIGGTDCAAIAGKSAFRSNIDVFLEKTGQEDKEERSGSQISDLKMSLGNVLESTVIDLFQKKTGLKVIRHEEVIRHRKYPYLLAHVDGLLNDVDGEDGVFEAKTAGVHALLNKSWAPERQGEAYPEDIPLGYYYQLVWYMTITNRDFGYLSVLLGGNEDFRTYYFRQDHALGVSLRKKMRDFWVNNVLTKTPPEPTTQGDSFKLHKKQNSEELIECDDKMRKIILKNKSLRKEMKLLFNQKDKLDALITDYISNKQGITYNGNVIATWKETKSKKRILKIY